MSFTYWFAKRFGVLVLLLYLGAAGVLIVSYYRSGPADSGKLSLLYPPGHSYPRTTKNRLVAEIFGFPIPEDEVRSDRETIQILSYTDDGAVVRVSDKGQETVPSGKVVRYLVNKDTGELEEALEPVSGPVNALIQLHIAFMKRVEEGVGGEDADGLRRLILPKLVIAAVYLGLVLILYLVLKRVDRISSYKGGFALTYGALIFWPISVIVISIAGTNVVDLVRHLPGSYHFMHSYVLGAWVVVFAWPVLVVALGLVDVIKSAAAMNLNQFLAHAAVLGAGVVSIPLVTIGALFAVLVCVLYVGYRTVKKVVVPDSLQKYKGLLKR